MVGKSRQSFTFLKQLRKDFFNQKLFDANPSQTLKSGKFKDFILSLNYFRLDSGYSIILPIAELANDQALTDKTLGMIYYKVY